MLRKIFSFRDIKYSWLLLISFVGFALTFYLDLYDESAQVQKIYLLGYWGGFILATLWGALNYIEHIRINVLYKKSHDIYAFINQLAMGEEEKLELQAYMEDYVEDQVSQGKPQEEATKEAINQFKIQEFTSLSKNTMLFNLHGHYYLGGYAFFAVALGLISGWLYSFFPALPIIVVQWTFFAYAVGFVGMFFVYKLVDATLYKKLK